MRPELAQRLLDRILPWDETEASDRLPRLSALADLKWDRYEGFRAGQRFMESLALWLDQFPSEQRLSWLDFVLERMIFVSPQELDHAMSVVYPSIIRPLILKETGVRLGVPEHRHRQVAASPEFRDAQRRVLVLGLSDGARLDRLRRLAELSHEQFSLAYEFSPELRERARVGLRKALSLPDEQALFRRLLLVDDFYGSGTSLIDHDDEGRLKGKVARILNEAARLSRPLLREDGPALPPLLDPAGYRTGVVLYSASERARDHIRLHLDRAGLQDWHLDVVQVFPDSCLVRDEALVAGSEWFYDKDAMDDEHKKGAALGYKGCALPVVLAHNTPNNSISPLWSDTTGRSLNRRALFPRYERHHPDRM